MNDLPTLALVAVLLTGSLKRETGSDGDLEWRRDERRTTATARTIRALKTCE
jgi:hypothetical protein